VEKTYPMKVIKLSPSERKIGLSIRAMRVDQDRADWQAYAEGGTGRPQATLADHFRQQQKEDQ
ncbi:MAG: rpsA 1, partial [Acidobacteria bacterium]|nr:rpsA 1 [Acidobacteriota bacterium]